MAATVADRTTSASRQFIVYGTNPSLRGAISDLAEKIKSDLLALLRRTDSWKTPILLNLRFPEANVPDIPAAGLQFSQTGAGLKIQLDLTIAAKFNPELIERELMRAVLLEMIYRNKTDVAADTPYVEPPDWLIQGSLAKRDSPKRISETLRPLLTGRTIPPLAEFLEQRAALLDPIGRTVYRADAAVFLDWLLDQPQGCVQLGRYIDNLWRASNDPLSDLAIYFPFLNDSTSNQQWNAFIARFCSERDYELLTFEQTNPRLDEVLALKIDGPDTAQTVDLSLDDLVKQKHSPAELRALSELSRELTLLDSRANPLLRPVIAEYKQVAELLAHGKTRGVGERLARVRLMRARLTNRITRIGDYLNWFEATQAHSISGTFQSYLDAERIRAEPSGRRDAISTYLDALEMEF